MKLTEIKSNTWYAPKESWGYPPPVLVLDTRRFSRVITWRDNARVAVLRETPDAKLGSSRRSASATGLLSIVLRGQAITDVREWVRGGQDEDNRPEVMALAERMLVEVSERVAAGDDDWNDLERLVVEAGEPDAGGVRPLDLMLTVPRSLEREYAEDILARIQRDRDNAKAQAEARKRREAEEAYSQETLALADRLDLRGNAWARSGYNGGSVEMSMKHFRTLLEEIERLRALNAATLRTDEIGEGEPCG